MFDVEYKGVRYKSKRELTRSLGFSLREYNEFNHFVRNGMTLEDAIEYVYAYRKRIRLKNLLKG